MTYIPFAILGSITFKSTSFSSQGVGAGTYYTFGFYDAPAADANLDEIGDSVTYASVDLSHASHVFVVAGGAGVTDGTDLVLTVSGTSIDDNANRTPADSEVIVADCEAAALNSYYETNKKWIGQVTITLTSTGGANYNFDFNYGLAKYDDHGNRNFTLTDIEAVGLSGGNDNGFNIELIKHTSTGWTYSAAAFVPGPAPIADMNTDHNTEVDLLNGEYFAWKRNDLNEAVNGAGMEGFLVRITTTSANAVECVNIQAGIRLDSA